jgi:hypothetical protein
MNRVERWIRAERLLRMETMQRLPSGTIEVEINGRGLKMQEDGWRVNFPEMYGKRLRCHCIPRELL